MRASIRFAMAVLGLGLLAGPAPAATSFNVVMTGANETLAGGTGDPNGSAIGTITLDAGSGGTTATASWNLTLAGLTTPPVTDFHIHTGTATQQGSVLIPFGVNVAGGDTLTQTSFIGSRTGLNSTNMANVLANPTGFYFNIHNGEFPVGAVRSQVPEPSAVAWAGVAAMGIVSRRRRRRLPGT
jgi:hypothetical protein